MNSLYFCKSVFFAIVFFECFAGTIQAQDYKKHFPTEAISTKKDIREGKKSLKRKHYDYIYVESGKEVLYGNPCAIQATRRMGFEYVMQPLGTPGSPDREEYELNNFWIKTKLFFTRSPFWKLIINRRIKKCRERSGDFVG